MAPNSCVWMGLTSQPVARTTRLVSGNLRVNKRRCEGANLVAYFTLFALNCHTMTQHTPTHTHTNKHVTYVSQLHRLWCYPSDLHSNTTHTSLHKGGHTTAWLADIICRVIEVGDDLGLCVLLRWVGFTDANIVVFMQWRGLMHTHSNCL